MCGNDEVTLVGEDKGWQLGSAGGSQAQMAGQPANNHLLGSYWYSNGGYWKSGNECFNKFSSK